MDPLLLHLAMISLTILVRENGALLYEEGVFSFAQEVSGGCNGYADRDKKWQDAIAKEKWKERIANH